MDTGAPRTILQATRNGVRKMKRQEDMENLQDLTCACKDFEVSMITDGRSGFQLGMGMVRSGPIRSNLLTVSKKRLDRD